MIIHVKPGRNKRPVYIIEDDQKTDIQPGKQGIMQQLIESFINILKYIIVIISTIAVAGFLVVAMHLDELQQEEWKSEIGNMAPIIIIAIIGFTTLVMIFNTIKNKIVNSIKVHNIPPKYIFIFLIFFLLLLLVIYVFFHYGLEIEIIYN